MADSTDYHSLAQAVLAGERRALARAITLAESTRPDHREQAVALLEVLAPATGGAHRIAISGTPGVGKSTFIEALGTEVIENGHRIAVLAIDPSSMLSGGSILGDKTRMEKLTVNPNAFIRPSPSGGTLGGVAARTREAMLICEAAGFDVVVVETVGVGQSETMAAQMTDMFVLLLAPGGGDELQGIKRGIMELADMILVNKADGDLVNVATKAVSEYRLALQLIRPRSEHWRVPVETCSSLTGDGIVGGWKIIREYFEVMKFHDELTARRANQALAWMHSEISDALAQRFNQSEAVRSQLATIEGQVREGKLPPTTAAERLLNLFQSINKE